MQNGNAKFNMFEGLDETKTPVDAFSFDDENESEIVSVTAMTDTKKKYAAAVVTRTQEEYEECIESYYFETLTHPTTGEKYEVKVTVLKPEVNPMELLRPAYAFATSHS